MNEYVKSILKKTFDDFVKYIKERDKIYGKH
jgi:hypothetical protein